MENVVGKALVDFERTLADLRQAISPYPAVAARVFDGTEDWSDLLTYKLVPHLAGQGCLVVAVTGGTNTGKSTVFNLLVGGPVSPIVNTAAATCHPVLAANATRQAQCLESKLVPEFAPEALSEPTLATDPERPEDALYVALEPSLPDSLVIMDTPDVDSIVRRNWALADHIRAAGDVLIAVLTGEKYKDERVVEYFREAIAASRVVVPLMNKANPADNYEVARKQLDEFRTDVGTDAPRFVIAHDFDIGRDTGRRIESIDGEPHLRRYLEGLDVPAIKERVFSGTVARFHEHAGDFIERAEAVGEELKAITDRFDRYAGAAVREYDPAPGKEVGGLFHEFVQAQRGTIRRAIGATSATVVRGASAVGRTITGALRRRVTLDGEKAERTDEKLAELHRQAVERITRDLATRYVEECRNLAEPARSLIGAGFEQVDMDATVAAVAADAVGVGSISDEFRRHANATLERWWEDHKGKRRALEALDAVLAVMPAAIAAPIALHTGGVGVSEAVVFAGPLAAQFITRVMEYQFGDALFDFLSPWKQEQQATLKAALITHLTGPCLAPVHRAIEPLEGAMLEEMKGSLARCLPT